MIHIQGRPCIAGSHPSMLLRNSTELLCSETYQHLATVLHDICSRVFVTWNTIFQDKRTKHKQMCGCAWTQVLNDSLNSVHALNPQLFQYVYKHPYL